VKAALTVPEAAEVAERERGVSLKVAQIHRLIRPGVLPPGTMVLRLGRHLRVKTQGFLAWLDAGGSPPPTRPAA
jgi:hypothetical protein